VSRKGQTNAALLAGLHTRPPIDVGCTPGGDEGATRRVALHRSAARRTKAGRGRRDTADDHSSTGGPARDPPSRCEDTRVRECDLITCCVASPPPERSCVKAKASRAGVTPHRSRGAKRIGLGETSHPSRCPHRQRDAADLATGVSEVARVSDSAGRQRPFRAQRHQHRSAQRRRETPSAPASLRKLERTR
jgi:hypothetical protein